MKKRTEKPEHITLEERRLPGNEEMAADYRLRMNAWRESNHYTAKEFPKRRYYVVLLRNKKTGMLCAYDDTKTVLSASHVMLFTTRIPYQAKNGKFSIKEYRRPDGYSGHEQATKTMKRLQEKGNADLYEMFVSRVGSKKCPIKVMIDPLFDVSRRAPFKVKE